MRVFIFLFLSTVSMLSQAALERPFEREARIYEKKLFDKKYEELSRLAQEYAASDTTISDGQPALAALHGGVSGCLSNGCTDYLSENEWSEKLGHLKEWTHEYPNSTTAKVALASYYMEYAWHARGQGYSNTVSEEGWELFRECMKRSHEELVGISKIGKNDPRWYDSMLMIGLAQKWRKEKLDTLYAEGVKKYPLYLPLYFDKSAYLAPRWYGSNEELRAYVEEAVKKPHEKLGETLYARLNWSLRTNDMFTNGQADWDRMRGGFERMINDYPDPWNINNFAKFSCMAQDWKTVDSLSHKIEGKPVKAAWSNSFDYYNRCINYAKYMVNKAKQKDAK